MIGNILDNTTELYMIKYKFGEIFSSGGATLCKNPSDQTVREHVFNDQNHQRKWTLPPWLRKYLYVLGTTRYLLVFSSLCITYLHTYIYWCKEDKVVGIWDYKID